MKFKIIFAGTPQISADVLQDLLDHNHNISGVLTKPDCCRGRGKKLLTSPVKVISNLYRLKVFQPVSLTDNIKILDMLAKLKADVMIVFAYGLILPRQILAMPKYGCINIHLSLLPKWRGSAPVQRAIEAGDEKTGVSIMQMDKSLDTGDLLYQIEVDIDKNDTTTSLTKRLKNLSIAAIHNVLADISKGFFCTKQQFGKVTYAKKLTKQESRIDWALPAQIISQKVRAFNPWPGAFIILYGIKVKISEVSILFDLMKYAEKRYGTIINISNQGMDIQSASYPIRVSALQFPGKKMISVSRLLHGYNLKQLIGSTLI